ncbi:MAG: M48 family metalloprotease [Gemmatimonadales bacterium]|nr:M48 family metalloprotease [Gemmatimonadales bacterium]NIN10093.1 M48 family metalloprotease [Gemmatimonadales bacterium]NIR02577.1 M48 family metalloprotease [Gemmatimonadales bacterium]NIS66271.1 M48 family metalloprotease [Gemmatimonadales bacterium]
MTADANLFAQQKANRRRSAVLVTIFVLFFAWIGFGGDLAFYLYTLPVDDPDAPGRAEQAYRHVVPWFGIGATLLGLGMALIAWHRGPKQILWATGAWELINASKPEEKKLINVVEEMAIASGLPRPNIWIVPDKDPNAFATGTDEHHSHVAVTQGLLETLDRDELQGVVSHEMAHIQNHDVKLMTLLAALVGVMALISEGAWRVMRFGGYAGRRGGGGRSGGGGGRKGGAGALALIVLVVWLISVLIAPVVSRLLALAVSRKREFLADATGAQFTRNPGALASALRKIEDAAAPTRAIKRGTAHLCIADPLGRRVSHKQGFVADILATHPPMAVRVARLKRMAYQYERTGVLPEAL